MQGTSLAVARGYDRGIKTQGKRRKEMLPICARLVCKTKSEEVAYILETAEFMLANRRMGEAKVLIRKALMVELRRWIFDVTGNQSLAKIDPINILKQLMRSHSLHVDDYRFLVRIYKPGRITASEFEDIITVVRVLARIDARPLARSEGGA